MALNSNISWTDHTWNIARGCTKVDEDCKFCYMYRESLDSTRYNPLQVIRTKTVFNLPLTIKEPSKIFTCSLTDFFHEDIDSYRDEAWDIIRKCPQHTFQILTKRPERISQHLPRDWGEYGWENVWLGTSCGSPKSLHRIKELIRVGGGGIKFVSFEPLWGKINILDDLGVSICQGIDWGIIGGESGNENGKYRYRPCELNWIETLIGQLQYVGASVFVKQLGTHLSKQLRLGDRHGTDVNEFPQDLRLREFPATLEY